MFDGSSDLVSLASTIGGAAALLGFGAVIGYLVGLQTAAARWKGKPQTLPAPADEDAPTAEEFLTGELRRCLEAARTLSGSDELAAELKLIEDAANAFSQRHKGPTDEQRAINSSTTGHNFDDETATGAFARGSTLSTQELQHFTATQAQVASASDHLLRRYPYDCYQLVLPWSKHGTVPNRDLARRVRCHDISGDGISFFWPREPKFERLIVMLGTGETPTMMLAKVAHFRPVAMHDQEQFLVGCQFLQRLEHQQPLRQEAELVYGEA